tara:strand:+ start:228 stop:692 length:465 start_codon:yes stop_codon:yes gene_type:complete
MIKINIISNNKSWKYYLSNPSNFIHKKIKNLNRGIKIYKRKTIYCTLLLSGDREIKKLNKKFRKKNKSTDILSFPFHSKKNLKDKIKNDKEIYLGDIIINLNKIKNRGNKKKFIIEFNKLWIHGLVHLLGHDHKQNKDFNNMQKIEKKFLFYIN